MNKPKIVVFGGGQGLSVILRGLKHLPVDLTAIVSVADSGGSSGILKQEFNIPAPGDLRNAVVALSNIEPIIEKVLQYRFRESSSIGAHPIGNLLITAMTEITGDVQIAIEKLRKLFGINGKILPATLKKIELVAEKMNGGVVFGEYDIPVHGEKIKRVFYNGEVNSPLENIKAVEEADLIIFALGSLYTSIIPNLLLENMRETLKKSKAQKIYVCNAMQQIGETEGYTVSDHIKAIHEHGECELIDKVIVNNFIIPDEILKRYEEEKSFPVVIDEEKLNEMKIEVVKDKCVGIDSLNRVRHIPNKLAAIIYSQIDNLEKFYVD